MVSGSRLVRRSAFCLPLCGQSLRTVVCSGFVPGDDGFSTWRPRQLSKSVSSRVIILVTPYRVLTYNSTYNPLNPKPQTLKPKTLHPKP